MESLYVQNCCWHFTLLSLTSSFVSMPLLFRDAQPVFPFVARMFLTHSLMYPEIVSCVLTHRTTQQGKLRLSGNFVQSFFDILPLDAVFRGFASIFPIRVAFSIDLFIYLFLYLLIYLLDWYHVLCMERWGRCSSAPLLLCSCAPSPASSQKSVPVKELTHKVRKDTCLETNFKDFNMLKIFLKMNRQLL